MRHWQLAEGGVQVGLSALALLALLVYTWTHTGALLARYVQPAVVGYVCAFGIEAAIVSLSLRIGALRRRGESPRLFVAVLVAVLIVSALANMAEGYATAYGHLLTVARIGALDALQAVIGIAATGLLSLVVFALAEIIGGDVRRAAVQAERSERQQLRLAGNTADAGAPPGAAAAQLPPTAAQLPAAAPQAALSLPQLPAFAPAGAPARTFTCDRCGRNSMTAPQYAAHRRYCRGGNDALV